MRPAKTQISLSIRAVWSESLLIDCAFYGFRVIQRGIYENLCHTGRMDGLIWDFAGHMCLIVGLIGRWHFPLSLSLSLCFVLIYLYYAISIVEWFFFNLYIGRYVPFLCWFLNHWSFTTIFWKFQKKMNKWNLACTSCSPVMSFAICILWRNNLTLSMPGKIKQPDILIFFNSPIQ